MIHLITVVGKHAENFYLAQTYLSDFKSLMNTITSGRVLLISTKFRSDLFYSADNPKNNSILKLWALYAHANQSLLENKDLCTSMGNEESLSNYFLSINRLSANRYQYEHYKKVFDRTFNNDQQNPVAMTVIQCDQHLVEHTSIKRTPLINPSGKKHFKLTKDSFSLAMHIIKNETHVN
ncbi:MAG: hypothetical protein OCD76_14060 [Reichenbachiella sp.]